MNTLFVLSGVSRNSECRDTALRCCHSHHVVQVHSCTNRHDIDQSYQQSITSTIQTLPSWTYSIAMSAPISLTHRLQNLRIALTHEVSKISSLHIALDSPVTLSYRRLLAALMRAAQYSLLEPGCPSAPGTPCAPVTTVTATSQQAGRQASSVQPQKE